MFQTGQQKQNTERKVEYTPVSAYITPMRFLLARGGWCYSTDSVYLWWQRKTGASMFGVWSCNTEDFTCSWSSLQLQSHAELDFVCYSVVLEIFIPCCHIIQQGTFFVLDAPCANMNFKLWKPKKFDVVGGGCISVGSWDMYILVVFSCFLLCNL